MDPGIGAPWSLETLWKYDEQAKVFYLIWSHSTKKYVILLNMHATFFQSNAIFAGYHRRGTPAKT